MFSKKKVLIIGAGINGLVSGYYLARQGHDVIFAEGNSEQCMLASHQNGGQLSFAHIDSIASYVNILQGLKSLACLGRPIKVSPSCFTDQAFCRFAKGLLLSSARQNRAANLASLATFAALSKDSFYEEFVPSLTQQELSFADYKQGGILHFFTDVKYLNNKIKHYKALKSTGFKPLTKNASFELEEALCFAKNICGGILFEEDASINCKKLSLVLRQKLEAMGAEFYFNTNLNPLYDFTSKNNGILKPIDAKFNCDIIVLANGTGFADFNKDLHLVDSSSYNAFYQMIGYSFDIDLECSAHAPQMAITDSANRIVYSVHGNGKLLRVAGFADFMPLKKAQKIAANQDKSKRIDEMYGIFLKTFPALKKSKILNKWIGIRPCTSSSLPIVQKSHKFNNVIVSTGHTNLGLTLSFASAAKIVKIIEGI
jgi:D-amino-acid dehydrogenase